MAKTSNPSQRSGSSGTRSSRHCILPFTCQFEHQHFGPHHRTGTASCNRLEYMSTDLLHSTFYAGRLLHRRLSYISGPPYDASMNDKFGALCHWRAAPYIRNPRPCPSGHRFPSRVPAFQCSSFLFQNLYSFNCYPSPHYIWLPRFQIVSHPLQVLRTTAPEQDTINLHIQHATWLCTHFMPCVFVFVPILHVLLVACRLGTSCAAIPHSYPGHASTSATTRLIAPDRT